MRKKFTKESFWSWVLTKIQDNKDATIFYKKVTGENPPKS